MKQIFSLNLEVISLNLRAAVEAILADQKFVPLMGVRNIYFAGQTLCMDYDGRCPDAQPRARGLRVFQRSSWK
jgi:hypothetical protein